MDLPDVRPLVVAFIAVVLPPLLLGAHLRAHIGRIGRGMWWALAGAIGFTAVAHIAVTVRARIAEPVEWDFLNFWLGARVAAQGLNFYDPLVYQQQPLPLEPSAEFAAEVLRVGYAYPPISMLLMLPLGWFPYATAYALWYAATTLALVAAIVVSWRDHVARPSVMDLALVALLVLLLRATHSTVSLGQSNFLLLLALTLAWRAREGWMGGVWTVLAAVVKPYALLLLPWFVLRRLWRAAAGGAIALATSVAAAVALFGAATCAAYVHGHVVDRFPFYMYAQTVNQSLLALLLRRLHVAGLEGPATRYPPFLFLALAVAAVTAWATVRDRSERATWSLGAALVAALLVYPGGLSHYSVVLLPPVLALWEARARLPGGPALVGAGLVLFYVLHAPETGEAVVVARVALWGTLVLLALRSSGPADRPVPMVRTD